jgi:glutaminyl-peptide cyclotransferase
LKGWGWLGGAALDVQPEPLEPSSPYFGNCPTSSSRRTRRGDDRLLTPLVALFSENLRRFEKASRRSTLIEVAGYRHAAHKAGRAGGAGRAAWARGRGNHEIAPAPGFAPWPQVGANLPNYGYQIVHVYPHDPKAFTQGLQYVDGVLYEGTGQVGQSSIRKVELATGKVLQQRDLPPPHFGEGITVWKNDLIELTWQTHVALVYDRATFEPKKQFTYPGEGWGLTQDATGLIMSDGTDELRILDPITFAERRDQSDRGAPLRNLNELEYVKGEIFANIWQTDYIVRIAPDTGKVGAYIDLRGLLTPAERAGADVLNGIAYDAAHDRLFVTGKWWPKLFEITLSRR